MPLGGSEPAEERKTGRGGDNGVRHTGRGLSQGSPEQDLPPPRSFPAAGNLSSRASRVGSLTATYPAVRSCPFSAETGGTGGPRRKQWLRHRSGEGGDAGREPGAAV